MEYSCFIAAVVVASQIAARTLPWVGGPERLFHHDGERLSLSKRSNAKPRTYSSSTPLDLGGVESGRAPVISHSLTAIELAEMKAAHAPRPGEPGYRQWLAASERMATEQGAMTAWGAAVSRSDDASAERALAGLLSSYPDEPTASVMLGELLAKRGAWNEAASVLTDPRCPQEWTGGSIDECGEFLRAAVLAHIGYVFKGELAALNAARRAPAGGNTTDAAVSPATVEKIAWMGGSEAMIGPYPERALQYARRAAEVAPSDPEVVALLGGTLLDVGKYDEATTVLKPYVGKVKGTVGRALDGLYEMARKNRLETRP